MKTSCGFEKLDILGFWQTFMMRNGVVCGAVQMSPTDSKSTAKAQGSAQVRHVIRRQFTCRFFMSSYAYHFKQLVPKKCPFGTTPHVLEPQCPGVVDRYIDLSGFYDRTGLQPLKEDILNAAAEYQGRYRRVYRCLGAAGELRRDMAELLDGPEVQQRLAKRAAGIISRELKRPPQGEGRVAQRFLSAVTHKGALTLWNTVEAQAERVYELVDNCGLAHHMLDPLLTAALAAGHDAVACPDPMAPDRLAHLIFPGLSLAFVTSTQEDPWPHRAYRRLRLDAMADAEVCRLNRPRLRFTRRVASALLEEGIAGLAQAKEAHDRLERLYNPYVDFDSVSRTADQLAQQILALREE